MKELFKVLKDHNNKFMQDLVTASYQQCFLTVAEGFLSDSESMDEEECGTENVVSVRVIQALFKSTVSEAIDKMMGAKLVIDCYGLDGNSQESQEERTSNSMELRLGDKRTVLINDISIAMRRLEYDLYRGTVYKKCEGATYTYSYKCDVKAFVNSLPANESFKARLLRDMKKVIDILADPDCEVIRPIVVDYNLTEVDKGKRWFSLRKTVLEQCNSSRENGPGDSQGFLALRFFQKVLENSLS